jgi:hypothetical protein
MRGEIWVRLVADTIAGSSVEFAAMSRISEQLSKSWSYYMVTQA